MNFDASGRTAIAVVFLTITVSVTGCTFQDPAARNRQKENVVAVKAVAVAEKEVVRTTVQPATVHAYYRAEIRAKAHGYVSQLKADIGDFVEAGAALAVIDVPEMEKQHQVMEARILRFQSEERRSVADVDLAKANVQSANAKLAQSKSQLNRAEAFLAAAEAEFDRTSDLVQRQSLERRVLDEVRKKRDSELANKESVASAITSAEADVVVAQAKQAAAEADLQATKGETDIARKEMEEIEVMMDYATLKAPFAGVVTSRSVDLGDLVREDHDADGQSLMVVSQVDKVRIHIPVPEVDAVLVNRGDAVSLTFPSFSDEDPIPASVTRVSSSLDPSTRTMLVEVELQNPDKKLVPGMFGQATITLSTKVAANMLPARAIRFDESGQAYVYVVGQDERVSVVNVTTGIDDGSTIEILSGVQSGQRVVDAHLKRFTTGQQVTIISN